MGVEIVEDDIQFLIELQKQIQYEDKHDYDSQAAPRFWVVGDYKWVPAMDGSEERYSVVLPQQAESYEINGYLQDIKEEREDLSEEAREEFGEIECEEAALEWIIKFIDEDAYLVPEEKVHFIRENTMFLTKEEAKRHIELNHYHYTSEAHTYAMTAWRSPKVSRLLKILKDFDWQSMKVKMKEEK